jgi:hypothetical protein
MLTISSDELNPPRTNDLINSKCKFNYPEFIEMINDFDILCLVETTTDVCDNINIPGYTVKMKRGRLLVCRYEGGSEECTAGLPLQLPLHL